MKKLFALLLVLSILCVSAIAEVSPVDFMTAHGLIALDEAALSEMGGEGGFAEEDMDYTYCIISTGANDSTPAIIWKGEDGNRFIALDMAAAFGGEDADPSAIIATYCDFCREFSFEVYVCAGEDGSIACASDEIVAQLSEGSDDMGDITQICNDLDEYIVAVSATTNE